jgi:hypothetical protein
MQWVIPTVLAVGLAVIAIIMSIFVAIK